MGACMDCLLGSADYNRQEEEQVSQEEIVRNHY